MKRVSILFIIMLLAISHGYADTDQADHWDKVRQLDEMAERFKAETGFTGSINYGYERMRLGSFEGNFSDIQYSADEDTIAFRQACERIVEKILPLSPVNRMQLSMSRISKSVRGYTTDYIQQVGGYRVEGSGFIVITYEEGRKRFSIGDNTVELPEGDVSAMISKEAAEQIALIEKNDEHYIHAKCLNLFYSNEGSTHYYLAYLVIISSDNSPLYDDVLYWIDAMTGDVKYYIENPSIR